MSDSHVNSQAARPADQVQPERVAQLSGRFLTAQWRRLVMANYRVDRLRIEPLVPQGVEIDDFHGETFVSVVGFLFVRTRVLGLAIPWHCHFEELNLRFYVRRQVAGELRRGVVFVKEIVPRRAIAWTARLAYNENYVALPMSHEPPGWTVPSECGRVEYSWRVGDRWNRLSAEAHGPAKPLQPGSLEEFIAEHYWGYCRQRDGGTVEYRVEHPRWNVWSPVTAELDCAVGEFYGREFVDVLSGTPDSALIADGSAIAVGRPRRIRLTDE